MAGSSRVIIMPNKAKGLVAGSTVRDLLVLAGIKNVTAKLHSGSKNKLNNGRAAYEALFSIKAKAPAPKIIIPDVIDIPVVGINKDLEETK